MENSVFISAQELSKMLECSVGHAYRIIKQMNMDLQRDGFIVFPGRAPRTYVLERIYGSKSEERSKENEQIINSKRGS